ncbi:hypothetical protein [Vreelandella sp. EE7]
MGIEPLKAREEIFAGIQGKRIHGEPLYDTDMQRFLKQAQSIPEANIERDATISFVLSSWKKFSRAEKAIDNMLNKWGRTPEALYWAMPCYVLAMCYEKYLRCAQEALRLEPQNHTFAKIYGHATAACAALAEHKEALEIMKNLELDTDNTGLQDLTEILSYVKSKGIADIDLGHTLQKYIDIAKKFITNNPNIRTGTQIELVKDHETGEQELWLNVIATVNGKIAAQIDWEFSKQDASGLPESLEGNVFIGLAIDLDIQTSQVLSI